jgi:primosomal protein N' (replication factor Y)
MKQRKFAAAGHPGGGLEPGRGGGPGRKSGDEDSGSRTTGRVRVVVLQQGPGALDYRAPEDLPLGAGDIVRVPLGPRQILGVVWESDRLPARDVPVERLRPVSARYDVPGVREPLRRLVDWVADYYLAPHAAVLRMVLSAPSALEPARLITEYRLSGCDPGRITPQRAQAIARLAGVQGVPRELARKAEVTEAVIRGLIACGVLEPVAAGAGALRRLLDPDHAPPALEAVQEEAAGALVADVRARAFAPVLLDGVTGSGKTEVYFEAVAEALRRGLQALVLLPEIALTQVLIGRFAARFGERPHVWHSGLRQSERRETWRAVAEGRAQVVVGARSALFLPFRALGLIVVDEAHEASFKQEEGVSYHGRDAAVMRAQLEACPVVLATATPAIETRVQADRGRYRHLKLPDRFQGARLPAIRMVDLRRTPPPPGRWLSPPLTAAIEARLAQGEQSLLFLNRRGYAPLTLCRACGERIQCPNCTSWLVEHRLKGQLVCHHCGFATAPPASCPACGEEGRLVPCGPGVERVAEEAARLFPAARTALVTSDTIWSPAQAEGLVAAVEAREIDLLIGTQLVTKGYHFPELTLVGIVDADLGLGGGDLRAAERTFQQLSQAAGRAGRASKPGEVLIQTYQPEARVMQALATGDAEAFYEAETGARRELGMPPFGRLAAIIISGTEQQAVADAARELRRLAPDAADVTILGPAPAPLAVLRGRHRQRLLVHARRSVDVQSLLSGWLQSVAVPPSVRVGVDVDPYSFL